MDKNTKKILESLYTEYCFIMAQTGKMEIITFLIKDEKILPVMLNEDVTMRFDQYISFSISVAHENNADAIVLLAEQFMVKGKRDNTDIQNLITGKSKASEHPDKQEHLVLSYMSAEGETHLLFGEIKTDMLGTRYVSNQQWSHNSATSVLVPWK